MGIKFKSPLALSAHRAIAHSDDAQTLQVTVVTKTAAHPEFGNGSANGYAIDSVEGAYLEFTPGNTYKFDQSDSSNTGHPLAFYEDAAKTVSYTTGVTTSGTPGSGVAYTQIIPTALTPPILYYQCTAHSLMGSYTKFGTGSLGGEADSAIKILLTVKNVSSSTLASGTVVRVAPTSNPPSGNVLEVDVADNSAASTMPAVGVLIEDITAGSEGSCVAFGRASGFSTSGFTEGDTLYVNTSGGFTTTKPTGTALIQRIGQVVKVHASNGSIEVFGAGRSNDVPNIPQDQLWLGNSSGVATATSHTVENISNVTTSSKTDGQSLVWDAANSYWKNATVSGGGGGGASELSIETNEFTATANQTAFVISSDITSSSSTQAYIDGVYQSKDNYTTAGSTVTFSTGVPVNSKVEIVHFISVLSKVYTDDFTGDGSTVAFTASNDVTDENVTQIYIDGVYQSKDNYSTSGTTITFSTAPPNGSAVEVVHFVPATYSTLNSNQFTGTGSQTDFTLTQEVEEDKSFVFIQGVYQEKSTYSISGTTLTFTTAPQNTYSIEVITVGSVSVSEANGVSWQSSIKTADFTAVAGQGYFVNTTSAAVTVTLPSSPSLGNEVHIVDYAGTADTNNITITSSDDINASTNDVKIDYERGGVSLVYVDATQGWISYNAANETATALDNVPPAFNVDYLVVAGGGSGSGANGGGGGAGGLRTSYGSTSGGGSSAETQLNIDAGTNYTVTVGAGGAGVGHPNAGNNGANSVFSTITSIGGGHGGYPGSGASGGSGGGASYGSASNVGGAGTANQGYRGGNASFASGGKYNTAGGGGAAQAGVDAVYNSDGTDGGDGLAVSITGSSVTYAGGGGGSSEGAGYGNGGAGGGSNGTSTLDASTSNATANTGGGSGGKGGGAAGSTGSGGSGIVVLRYPNTFTVTIGAGLTGSTTTDGTDKVTTFTAGTGNISFS